MKLGPLVTNIKRGSVGKRDLEEHRLGNGLIRINEGFQVKSRRRAKHKMEYTQEKYHCDCELQCQLISFWIIATSFLFISYARKTERGTRTTLCIHVV